MLIKLQDLKEGDIVAIEHQYDPKKLDMEFVDLHYTKPLAMLGTVEMGHDLLTVRGHLSSETELLCGRCLSPAFSRVDKDFEFFYQTPGKDFIDTTDDVRELLILDHQLAYVCNDACKGLCLKCGINLNETKCNCASEPQGSLAQLKDIWNARRKEESK